jgi:glycerol-3-phosphate dehydrogenase
MATSDGRFLFFLPWMGKTLVGTTDVACPKPSPRPQPTEAEIQWLVDEASKYMVFPIRRSDVLSAWSGVRPLAVDPHATGSDDGKTSSLSRDHVVIIFALLLLLLLLQACVGVNVIVDLMTFVPRIHKCAIQYHTT